MNIRQTLFPNYLWTVKTDQPEIYLTFDDGPEQSVTPFVLESLEQYDAKATFFCLGKQIEKHPALFLETVARGHAVGNHTFNHPNGWTTGAKKYLDEIAQTDALIEKLTGKAPRYFRPPYGKPNFWATNAILKTHVLTLWDTLAYDWDATVSIEKSYRRVVDSFRPGSIVVLHDNLKSEAKLRVILSRVLEYGLKQGFQFKALPNPSV